MVDLQNFKILGITLAIGLLIGLERGWHTREKGEGMRIAGLRTYGLIALLGGLWGILSQQLDVLLMGFVFLALTLVLLKAYSLSLGKFEDYSITSTIAMLITFTLGVLTAFGHVTLASSTAVIITLLLGFKPLLHGWMNKLEQHELNATLKLLLISVVMLPILPDRSIDPWNVVNPYHVWWMVVLIAGISYLGYFAIRIVGNRHGPLLTGIFGGLVSSTAVTINLSRLSKTHSTLHHALSAGILTACATLFVRTFLLTSIINPELSRALMSSLFAMSVTSYLLAFLFWRASRDFQGEQEIRLENPFQLGLAIKFGIFLTFILLLTKLATMYFGYSGAYFLAAVSGFADVDPITLAMAQMSEKELTIDVAAKAILIAVIVNSGFKGIVTLVLGDHILGFRVVTALTAAVVVGLLVAYASSF